MSILLGRMKGSVNACLLDGKKERTMVEIERTEDQFCALTTLYYLCVLLH